MPLPPSWQVGLLPVCLTGFQARGGVCCEGGLRRQAGRWAAACHTGCPSHGMPAGPAVCLCPPLCACCEPGWVANPVAWDARYIAGNKGREKQTYIIKLDNGSQVGWPACRGSLQRRKLTGFCVWHAMSCVTCSAAPEALACCLELASRVLTLVSSAAGPGHQAGADTGAGRRRTAHV